jgi:hypothetical protein
VALDEVEQRTERIEVLARTGDEVLDPSGQPALAAALRAQLDDERSVRPEWTMGGSPHRHRV